MNFGTWFLVALAVIVVARLTALFRPGLLATYHARQNQIDRDARHSELDLLSGLAVKTGALGDERSWRDLDLDEVFHSLDYATSEIGRQCLYARLRQPELDPQRLREFGARVARVQSDESLAACIRATVSTLADRRAAFLVDLLFGELPSRPALWWTFPILTGIGIASLVLMPVWPRAFIVLLAVAFANLIIQLAFKPRVKRFVGAVHELSGFLRAAETASRITAPELQPYTSVLSTAREFRTLRRAAWWLMFEPGQSNELVSSVYEYINLFLLLDVNAFVFATERIQRARPALQQVFVALGELDVLQSTASWRRTLPAWSEPGFVPREQHLDVEDVYHPLLEAPVANSLAADGVGVLVTGSNMSGKTTFIRTLGVNAVLAQTLFTVCARRWTVPPVIVRTSIGRADSLVEGKSYYLAEAESVRALLAAKETGGQHLFLLDEIFRGTNTSERIAAAYGVLRMLVKGDDLVFVATHDLELIALLGDRFASCHFAEQVSESALTFDYRIRPGASSTRNAIALLRLLRYPDQVVADALDVVANVNQSMLKGSP